jgi:hypothetical protein
MARLFRAVDPSLSTEHLTVPSRWGDGHMWLGWKVLLTLDRLRSNELSATVH